MLLFEKQSFIHLKAPQLVMDSNRLRRLEADVRDIKNKLNEGVTLDIGTGIIIVILVMLASGIAYMVFDMWETLDSIKKFLK